MKSSGNFIKIKWSVSRQLMAAAALCFLSQASTAQTGFMFDEPEEKTPPKAAPAPKVTPKPSKEDVKTEAVFCPEGGNCKPSGANNTTPQPIDTSKVTGSDERSACYSKVILATAKEKVLRWYGNRGHSAGDCAKGVRKILQAAGFNHIGSLGDAYHFKRDGRMKALGFKDIYYPGMTAEQAPPGAVLIFRGPLTLQTNGVLPPRRARRGQSAGNWVGHVTIKGDNNFYYTDGRTRAPAGQRRYLVGVFVPSDCRNCTANVKQQCGG